MGVAHGQFDGFGQQEFLRRGVALLFEAVEHLLEQDPLVRGVLVEQDESAVGFEHDIKSADDADQAQRDVEERDAARGVRRGCRLQAVGE